MTRLAREESFLAAYTSRRGRREADREVLTFWLGTEQYGLDMSVMREIATLREITELPRVPAFLRGIISLRGAVVPIIDLRLRMGLPRVEPTRASRILVVEQGEQRFGLIVDRVAKVLRLSHAQVESTPMAGTGSEFLAEVARADDDLIALLDAGALTRFSLEGR
jgi:purine-binding chemotaxis protein CheW